MHLEKGRVNDMSSLFAHVDTLVFGGGGVKSVAYLGAIEEMCACGMSWKNFCRSLKIVAGSSAGSFSAALVGLGVELSELNRLMREFDSSILFRDGIASTLLDGMNTVFTCPEYGIIPWERLQDLYEGIFVSLGFVRGFTLSQYKELTGK